MHARTFVFSILSLVVISALYLSFGRSSGSGLEQHTKLTERAKLDALYPPIRARWATIYLGPDLRIALDTTTIVREARGVYSVWARIDWAKPGTEPVAHDQLVSLEEYNCGLRQVSGRAVTVRGGDEIVYSGELPTDVQQVEPGTVVELKFTAVCSFAQSRYP